MLDLHMTPTNRSQLEQAFELLGPKFTACLVTPMTEPRLWINSGQVENGLTFASLVQWFRLFYDGPLSIRKLGSIETGFGTAPPVQIGLRHHRRWSLRVGQNCNQESAQRSP
jgi:hypothetical protein